MLSSLTKNLGLLFLALGLALVVWVIAANEQNPDRSDFYPSPVPVQATNVPEGLVIYDANLGSVTVKIRAPAHVWGTLFPGNFQAVVDLTGLGPGTHEVAPKVTSADRRVRILEVTPMRVNVRLERLRQKEVLVRPRVLDSPASGYSYGQPQVSPAQVKVTGPASLVDQTTEALVNVRLDGTKVSLKVYYQPMVVNARGEEIKGLEPSPSSVLVEVPVVQLLNYKAVSVVATISGTVATGYHISSIVVEPSVVVLGGDPKVLEGLGYVETTLVDVSGTTHELVRSVWLNVPKGTALEKRQDVFVKIVVEPIPGGEIVRRPVAWKGLGKGLTVALSNPTVDVTLAGSMADFLRLRASDVAAVLDLSGLGSGTYDLVPQIVVPTGFHVTAVTPEKLPVTLKPSS
ncbi:MAG: CdaR family protein [Chloroflexota bacterium]